MYLTRIKYAITRRTCTCEINESPFSGGRYRVPKETGPDLLRTNHVHDRGLNFFALSKKAYSSVDFDDDYYSIGSSFGGPRDYSRMREEGR